MHREVTTVGAMGPNSVTAVSILAYVLLICATVPQLVTYEGTWALLPVWLLLTGYVAAISKTVTLDKVEADRYAQASRFAFLSYFVMKLLWPFPMHWFDGVATLALLFESESDNAGSSVMAVYYLAAAATYAGDPLQVTGRLLLALTAYIAATTTPDPV